MEMKVTAGIQLKEGFDLADLKVALAKGIEGKEYRLKNVYLEDDATEDSKDSEMPTHLLTYELEGNLDESQIKTELESIRDKTGTFVVKSVDVGNM